MGALTRDPGRQCSSWAFITTNAAFGCLPSPRQRGCRADHFGGRRELPVATGNADRTRRDTARDILAIDLTSADLGDADLTRTDLTGAYLRDTDLTSASLTDVRWPAGTPVPDGWMIDVGTGRLKRAGRLSEVTAP